MKKTLMGAIAIALAAGTAHAADVYQPQPEPAFTDVPEVQVQQSSSGWYLRGDIGYGFTDFDGADFYQGNYTGAKADFHTAKLRDGLTLGAGVGYQVNSYLRTDLTFDYFNKAKFEGSTRGSGAGFGACVGPCTSHDRSSMRAYSLLANAYVDLGTYGYITPYVGAGIGGTYVKWDKLRNTSCADNGSGCDPTIEHGGKGSWRFTYALMAGATIDVTCNLKADVGYRYRHVQGGDMFGYNQNGGPGFDKGFDLHEARVGARYTFGGCAAPYVPEEVPPQPIIYK
ncbi:outer membrane protein [Rhizobium sp. SSA_523]|uniref:outer membrane protein n=1 Tax=Rhizobium sp. SSA_523 TaxID=2952477 RepID=UPI002091E2BA|nr:outer membrane protein [Rhizobium sp. SSA_523]MCO5732010.1 porin family protein [Rhizobium sp. SSA_523]WKC22650.1 porin family protein [Rhizobium sp. SSA_523]